MIVESVETLKHVLSEVKGTDNVVVLRLSVGAAEELSTLLAEKEASDQAAYEARWAESNRMDQARQNFQGYWWNTKQLSVLC